MINLERDKLLSEQAYRLVTEFYLKEGETSPQEAYARAATAWSGRDEGLAQRLYDYVSQGWFMYASPLLSNAPVDGEKIKGMPISCFLSYVPDTVEGLIDHQSETAWLSVKGGGVGGHWSNVRAVDKKSCGPIPFIHTVDAEMTAYKQGETRKGAYAAYMDVSHPDINEFLKIRTPTGGDVNRKCFNIHNAVNITDSFMEAVVNDKDWNLVCPNSKSIRKTVDSRDLWQEILATRHRTGEPYLNFIDTANESLPTSQKKLGLRINGSNLCNEIHLPTDEKRTAVCCLSSVNLEKWDEWRDTTMVEDLITMLDNVLTFFINYAPKELHKAIYSATQERALGLGAMGWHGLLQKKGIPFESALAVGQTRHIFKYMQSKAIAQSMKLGAERGEAPDMAGTGRRNSHLLAIAPNANSSMIAGCSPSIEPVKSNAYPHRTRVGTHLIKNKYLEAYLVGVNRNTDEVWASIVQNEGSVQHLEFIPDYEKLVYKTFSELDMNWVIEQASNRQEFLCQGQSVNLYFPAECDKAYLNEVHLSAWKKKLKGLYYVRSSSGAVTDKVSVKVERKALSGILQDDGCLSCEG